jgi:RHS repeat-associated protein
MTGTTSFRYSADYERRFESVAPTTGAAAFDRYMLHAGAATFYEEDVKVGSVTNTNTDQHARIFRVRTGPGGPVGVLESRINTSGANIGTTQRYWHRDHLGSTTVNSDETGAEAGRYRYDPWGKPLSGNLTASAVGTGNRGRVWQMSGHEHLVGGLIHMNGRIYDPVLGRFLSADIVVQMPHNVQSYNRYSYVLNNPLGYTDPSGYEPLTAFAMFLWPSFFVGASYALGGKEFGRMVAGIAVGFLLGPAGMFGALGGGGFGGFLQAVAAGFAAGGVSTGNIQGAIRGGISAGLFFGAGSIADGLAGADGAAAGNASGAPFDSSDFASASTHGSANSVWAHGGIGRAGLHAIAGCAGALGGGKCGSGALSAGFAEFAGPKLDGLKVPGIVSRVIVGGIASELGGGKFANGAMTAAFGYLFNQWAHMFPSLQQQYKQAYAMYPLQDILEKEIRNATTVDYIAFNSQYGPLTLQVYFNVHTGSANYFAFQLSPSWGFGSSVMAGTVLDFSGPANGRSSLTSNFLEGHSLGANACAFVCAGVQGSLDFGTRSLTTLSREVGVGFGASSRGSTGSYSYGFNPDKPPGKP